LDIDIQNKITIEFYKKKIFKSAWLIT